MASRRVAVSRARTASPWSGWARIDESPPSVRAPLHELAALERLQSGRRVGREQAELERASDRHQLQQAARARAEAVDAQVDELGQARARCDLAAPAPYLPVLGQQAAFDAVTDQLAQEEGVAACQRPDRV